MRTEIKRNGAQRPPTELETPKIDRGFLRGRTSAPLPESARRKEEDRSRNPMEFNVKRLVKGAEVALHRVRQVGRFFIHQNITIILVKVIRCVFFFFDCFATTKLHL